MNPIKICIADAHAGVRKSFIANIKTELDCAFIAEGNNGKELLDALVANHQHADIAIVDLAMPVMNGYETIAHFKASYPSTKILVIAFTNAPDTLQHLFNIGINGFLSKAFNFIQYKVNGFIIDDIAEIMVCSTKTVENYRNNVYAKLGINTKEQLLTYAKSIGLEKWDA